MTDDNENNLVQKREDRRTLEKMRRKLATSGHMGKNNVAKLKPAQSSLRIWPFATLAVALLLGLNFFLSVRQEKALSDMGKTAAKAALAPPAGASLDDQARFWAYAAYDLPKLKTRFSIPKGAILDRSAAIHNLERLLPENLGSEVRNEIFTMQQAAQPAVAPKVVAKAIAAPAKK